MTTRDIHHISDHLDHGDAIVKRFAKVKVAATVKKPLQSFKGALAAYKKGNDAAGVERETRDAALANVGDEDALLDESVDELATVLVGAKITKRTRPFAGFSTYSPSDMCALPYATEAEEVKKLVTKVLAAKPPKEVVTAAKASGALAAKVKTALDALTEPQAAYSQALADRDAMLPALTKAQATLRKWSAAAWDKEPATLKGLFAPPVAVVAPMKQAAKKAKKTRAKKKAAKKGGGDPTKGS